MTLLKKGDYMTEVQLVDVDEMRNRVTKLVWNKLDHEAGDKIGNEYLECKSMLKSTDDPETRELLHEAKESAKDKMGRLYDDAFIAVISEALDSLDAIRKLNRELTKKLSE